MNYPVLMCLSGVLAMASTTAHAQSIQSYTENGLSRAETKPTPIEPVTPVTTPPDLQPDTASRLPFTQPAAEHLSDFGQFKAVTLLAVLPYFNSLVLLAQLSTVEKESLVLLLHGDIGKCETLTCLVNVQMKLNTILMDRVASLYKNVGWPKPKALSNPSRN